MKSSRDIIRTRRDIARKRIRFFKIADLDKIRISEMELKDKDGLEHLKTKAEVCLRLMKEGKEFITDCWITVKNGGDHWFADIFVTEEYKVIEIIPFEQLKFVLKEQQRWERHGITYMAVMEEQ